MHNRRTTFRHTFRIKVVIITLGLSLQAMGQSTIEFDLSTTPLSYRGSYLSINTFSGRGNPPGPLSINQISRRSKQIGYFTLEATRNGDVVITDIIAKPYLLTLQIQNGRLNLFIDGKTDNSASIKRISANRSLQNSADFLVGKSNEDSYFKGEMDFLRVCRGSLEDAETSTDELYQWQFNGPFLGDFTEQKPADGQRDAGAIKFKN